MDIALTYHRYRRDTHAAYQQALEMIHFTTERGLTDHCAKGNLFLGWTQAQRGIVKPGLELMRQGLAVQRAIGTKEDFPIYAHMLAEACLLAGRPAEGLAEIHQAIREADELGLRVWTAELHRCRGELLLSADTDADSAPECFETARAIAVEQQARSLELRAATSLAKLRLRQGQADAARALLQPISQTFTEGFGTRDLQEAKALLDETS